MYIELSYPEFEKRFPRIAKDIGRCFPKEVIEDFRNDSNYIVRMNDEGIEFGYASDCWKICS